MAVEFRSSPIISKLIAKLRDKRTDSPMFRKKLFDLGEFMAYELAKELPLRKENVESPLGSAEYFEFDTEIVIVAILRAALPMAEGVMETYPNASLGIVSASRGDMMDDAGREFNINMSYANIPSVRGKTVIIVDPMLASGSTMLRILHEFEKEEPSQIFVISAIAAKFGIERLERQTRVKVYTGIIDDVLNEKGYIVPGLGDAGDRAFHT